MANSRGVATTVELQADRYFRGACCRRLVTEKHASLYRNEVEYKPRRVWVLPAAGWSTRVRVLDLGLHATSGERSGRAALDGGKQAAASQPARDHGALAVPVYARVAGESCRQKHGQHSMAGAHPPGCTPLSWMEPDRP